MDFAFDETTTELQERLLEFMRERVYPSERRFHEEVRDAVNPWAAPEVIEELKSEARSRGLWNLFLPRDPRVRGRASPTSSTHRSPRSPDAARGSRRRR